MFPWPQRVMGMGSALWRQARKMNALSCYAPILLNQRAASNSATHFQNALSRWVLRNKTWQSLQRGSNSTAKSHLLQRTPYFLREEIGIRSAFLRATTMFILFSSAPMQAFPYAPTAQRTKQWKISRS